MLKFKLFCILRRTVWFNNIIVYTKWRFKYTIREEYRQTVNWIIFIIVQTLEYSFIQQPDEVYNISRVNRQHHHLYVSVAIHLCLCVHHRRNHFNIGIKIFTSFWYKTSFATIRNGKQFSPLFSILATPLFLCDNFSFVTAIMFLNLFALSLILVNAVMRFKLQTATIKLITEFHLNRYNSPYIGYANKQKNIFFLFCFADLYNFKQKCCHHRPQFTYSTVTFTRTSKNKRDENIVFS